MKFTTFTTKEYGQFCVNLDHVHALFPYRAQPNELATGTVLLMVGGAQLVNESYETVLEKIAEYNASSVIVK